MYQSCLDQNRSTGYIVMRPNLSENWQSTILFFGFVAFVPLVIAAVFAYLGFWLILPFAGLEVAVLSWAVLHVRSQGNQQEVLRFNEHTVALERGTYRADYRWERQRAWIKAHYERAPVYGHPHTLSLGYQNERCEFGRFLTDSEREALVSELSNAIRVLRS